MDAFVRVSTDAVCGTDVYLDQEEYSRAAVPGGLYCLLLQQRD
jgi:hypothetical protein